MSELKLDISNYGCKFVLFHQFTVSEKPQWNE